VNPFKLESAVTGVKPFASNFILRDRGCSAVEDITACELLPGTSKEIYTESKSLTRRT
jgi:hypothetical protein